MRRLPQPRPRTLPLSLSVFHHTRTIILACGSFKPNRDFTHDDVPPRHIGFVRIPAAGKVSDILIRHATAASYEELNATLLERTTASQRSRPHPLLFSEELGDRRPTQLLRRMTRLLRNPVSVEDDVLLRGLFLQRLPANVHRVLVASTTVDLSKLAALADTVMDVTTPAIAAVATPSTPKSSSGISCHATSQGFPPAMPSDAIQRLCSRLDQLINDTSRQAPSRSRNTTPPRRQSSARLQHQS